MPGLLRGVARTAVIAGTATSVSNRVSRRQAGRWAAEDQAQQSAARRHAAFQYAAPPPPPPPPQPAAPDISTRLHQLQQLGELKAQGLVSEEEFEGQKRAILGT